MAVSETFQFCSVCRSNHNRGRKHIYSKKHVNHLQNIIQKYGKKIDEVRRYVKAPSVIDGELEPGAQFWCHFCAIKVKKHVTDGNMSIQYGGVFEHLASDDHKKNTDRWWIANGADKTKTNDFLLSQQDLNKFRTAVEGRLKGLEKDVKNTYDESVLLIKETEERQKRVAEQPPVPYVAPPTVYHTVRNHLGILQNPTGCHEGQRVWGGGIVKYKKGSDQWYPWEFDLEDGRKVTDCGSRSFSNTFAAGASSSTKKVQEEDANINTGATPPWLIPDEDAPELPSIGPSLADFQKHVKRTKKLGKNPNRVGANFDRDTGVSEEWLPSFGGVWNAGPRWQTRRDLKTEKGKRDKS